ncbi:ATP-binding cassette domain-containing protein [Mycoplasmopsis phocirhinis]|uniref:ATP-binding cassette domain-containing protein n=1 Tax=Mycoplasmopsis phocirhinis TaxID=142650 RepID=A0A4P6MPS0_9BACT|nr:ATP-binding cassette domain-containing protein [Mycoplasmopsis phocirhinis]QBF34910.1 ATP-binding cassette domain-containing protein [Mycoplasmopsis phocirhinis]
MTQVIKITNLNFAYNKNPDLVLQDININIEKGSMVAIIGPSGVGKSTLFKLIVRAIKPKNGTIEIFNKDINKLNKKDWKKTINKVGFLTQKANLINTENVFENIKRTNTNYPNFIQKFFGILTHKEKIKIFETLDELGILNKAFYRVSELSGGQQQRVEIAKLLIQNVDLILADEPTSNLDNQTSREVLELLKKLSQDGKTILVNIHDLSFIKSHFTHVIAIKNKRVFLAKNTKEINQWELIQALKTLE